MDDLALFAHIYMYDLSTWPGFKLYAYMIVVSHAGSHELLVFLCI